MAKRENQMTIGELVEAMMRDIQSRVIMDDKNRLPIENDLMERYDVTRYTLRQALAQLSALGYVYQAQGIGTFGRPKKEGSIISLQHAVGLTAELERQGKKLTTAKHAERYVLAKDADFKPSGNDLDPETPLIEIKRYRLLDDQHYMFEQSYYLTEIVGEVPISAIEGSLFAFVVDNDQLKLGFQDKLIEATALKEENAWFFDLPVGSPMLTMNDASYLSSGQLFAFSKLTYDYRLGRFFMFMRM